MFSQHSLAEIDKFLGAMYTANYKSTLHTKKINDQDVSVDQLKIQMLTTTILPFKLNKVEIKDSRVHGRGVFATKVIYEGDLVTFYPGDICEFLPNGDRANPHWSGVFPSERFATHFGRDAIKDRRDNAYAYDVSKNYTIIGDPMFDSDPNYMGHFINDGAKPGTSDKSKPIYETISYLKTNCKFVHVQHDLQVAIVATKDIKPGEELFVMYGVPYWESVLKKQPSQKP